MRTRYHMDIDQMIEEMRADLNEFAPEIERYWTRFSLDKLIAERDEAYAELRASPDWDKLPF